MDQSVSLHFAGRPYAWLGDDRYLTRRLYLLDPQTILGFPSRPFYDPALRKAAKLGELVCPDFGCPSAVDVEPWFVAVTVDEPTANAVALRWPLRIQGAPALYVVPPAASVLALRLLDGGQAVQAPGPITVDAAALAHLSEPQLGEVFRALETAGGDCDWGRAGCLSGASGQTVVVERDGLWSRFSVGGSWNEVRALLELNRLSRKHPPVCLAFPRLLAASFCSAKGGAPCGQTHKFLTRSPFSAPVSQSLGSASSQGGSSGEPSASFFETRLVAGKKAQPPSKRFRRPLPKKKSEMGGKILPRRPKNPARVGMPGAVAAQLFGVTLKAALDSARARATKTNWAPGESVWASLGQDPSFNRLLFQVFYALYAAQLEVGFVHGGLGLEDVLITDEVAAVAYSWRDRKGGLKTKLVSGNVVKLLNFGRARVRVPQAEWSADVMSLAGLEPVREVLGLDVEAIGLPDGLGAAARVLLEHSAFKFRDAGSADLELREPQKKWQG